MLSRNDQPLGFSLNFSTVGLFNFAVDSVFSVPQNIRGGIGPVPGNSFLLLDGTPFMLLDGTNFLLL